MVRDIEVHVGVPVLQSAATGDNARWLSLAFFRVVRVESSLHCQPRVVDPLLSGAADRRDGHTRINNKRNGMSGLNTSPDDFGKRLRRLEDRMDKLERLIASLATKDDIKDVRGDIETAKNELKGEIKRVEDSLGRKIEVGCAKRDSPRRACSRNGFCGLAIRRSSPGRQTSREANGLEVAPNACPD